MAVTINVISDLHLEINRNLDLKKLEFKEADILIILGDFFPTGYFFHLDEAFVDVKAKIQYLKREIFPRYKKVFFILGNHDYYHDVYEDSVRKYTELFSDVPNLKVLENGYAIFEDYIFVGATLWTDFNRANPIDMLAVQQGFPDYEHMSRRYPTGEIGPINPWFIYEQHLVSKNFIRFVCDLYRDRKIIVMTHHAPSYTCINPKFTMSTINPGFASELLEFIIDQGNISHWLYGHTHYNAEFVFNSTSIISNQCGYWNHEPRLYENFKADKVITL